MIQESKLSPLDSILSQIEEEVDRQTDEKVIARSKNSAIVDRNKIRAEVKKNLFSTISKTIDEEGTLLNKFFEQLKMDDPKLFESIFEIKQIKDLIAKNTESIEEFQELNLAKYHPEDLEKVREQGFLLFNQGDCDKARLYFVFLNEASPENHTARLMRGMAEHNSALYDKAVQTYLMAISIDSKNILQYLQMMRCLILAKKIDEAKEWLDYFTEICDPSEFENNELIKPNIKIIQDHLKAA